MSCVVLIMCAASKRSENECVPLNHLSPMVRVVAPILRETSKRGSFKDLRCLGADARAR